MKTIVTHLAPDVDAVSSVWLLKRFLSGWGEADVKFVPAGKTLNGETVDSDSEILHVDTGMGMMDHHQSDEDTCAAKRVLEYISQQAQSSNVKVQNGRRRFPDEALIRMVDVINDIDHFREAYYPNPAADFYNFGLVSTLDGLNILYGYEPHKILDFALVALDGIYKQFQNKVWAEEEIKKKGIYFETKLGKGVALETINDEAIRTAQLQGTTIALRKDPKKKFVRIKALPESGVDLELTYLKLKKLDPEATWFLHASHKMVLNGSMKNPESRPSKLEVNELIDVIKKNI
ncbi:hypothetical protein A3D77_03080 [Candidatus Gottesmanbacteria bacterium RIFCSPHIGHO2_02_FULL_39_11]|uniref:Uncharacterized protein n=1 Tax=Candidatus Gottesmanbacteria bacterium RIFCSPHIGHO2_02_FULL_39_11 TaxID=1798382 RepID=A0A1F5ZLV5_9BACT|nr:MAG: hypothetical protein A3D77_03080 [Candidatus Gottesmanbacteria bacterium RIFCSPHIGHO2_02_FULL_39_11]